MELKQFQKKYNVSDIELYTQSLSEYKVSFVANKLKQTEITHRSGKAIRLLKNKKFGFSASYGDYNIEDSIKNAIDISLFSPELEILLPKKSQITDLASKEVNPQDLFPKISTAGKEIIDSSLQIANEALIDVSFDISTLNEIIQNTNELHYHHSNTIYSLSINIRETKENDFIEIFTATQNSEFPDYKIFLDELLLNYKLSKKHATIKNGHCPILFTSKASKELLNIIELALNGKQINQHSSPWHNKLGNKITSNLITITQDPAFGYMARSIDDEGNPIQPLTLINKGILESFYWDLSSSCKSISKQTSTGNGFKPTLTTQPEPTLLNMIVSTGSRSINNIIKDIKYGLLIDQTMGGLTSNVSGDLSVNVDIGFLIENGEIIGRVKDTMISGNIYTALNNIIELSNNPRFYWSNIYNPDMLIDSFTVTTK